MGPSARRVVSAVLFSLSSALIASPARADLGPPPGFVACTLEAQRARGDECLACRASAETRDRCGAALSDYGFEHRCRAPGLTLFWTELWCRPPSPSAKEVPATVLATLEEPSSGETPPLAPTASGTADGPPASPTATGEPLPAPPAVSPPPGGCGACAAGDVPPAPPPPGIALAIAAAALVMRFARRRGAGPGERAATGFLRDGGHAARTVFKASSAEGRSGPRRRGDG